MAGADGATLNLENVAAAAGGAAAPGLGILCLQQLEQLCNVSSMAAAQDVVQALGSRAGNGHPGASHMKCVHDWYLTL